MTRPNRLIADDRGCVHRADRRRLLPSRRTRVRPGVCHGGRWTDGLSRGAGRLGLSRPDFPWSGSPVAAVGPTLASRRTDAADGTDRSPLRRAPGFNRRSRALRPMTRAHRQSHRYAAIALALFLPLVFVGFVGSTPGADSPSRRGPLGGQPLPPLSHGPAVPSRLVEPAEAAVRLRAGRGRGRVPRPVHRCHQRAAPNDHR